MEVMGAHQVLAEACQEYEVDSRTFYCLRGQLAAYAAHWGMVGRLGGYQIVRTKDGCDGVEVELRCQVEGEWTIISYLDKLLHDETGTLAVMDHKLLGRFDFYPSSPDMRVLHFDPQIRTYQMAAELNDIPVQYHIQDVTVACKMAPKKVGVTFRKEIEEHGTYRGLEISEESYDAVIGVEDAFETEEMLSATVYSKIMAAPSKFFGHIVIPVDRKRVLEVALRIQQIAQEMDERSRRGTHWKNPSHCRAYGSTCEFLQLCDHSASPDDETLYKPRGASRDDDHKEDRSKRLSHSRISTYMNCHKKAFWRYEYGGTGLSSVKGDFGDGARRGSAWGQALDRLYRDNCHVYDLTTKTTLQTV